MKIKNFYLIFISVFLFSCEVAKEDKGDMKEFISFEIKDAVLEEYFIPVIKCEKDDDCKGKMGEVKECEIEKCDSDKLICQIVTADDGTLCDDGNPCTKDDLCKNGGCESGKNECECEDDKDCAIYEDGNLCNGTLFCNKENVPYVCDVDEKTIVKCDDSKDTQCLKNTCVEATGECEMKPANEDGECDDKDLCTENDKCKEGECIGDKKICDDKIPCTVDSCKVDEGCVFVPSDELCNDNNICTEDKCDEKKGCIYNNLDIECNDKNECTTGDKCVNGECVPEKEIKCDDNNPCTDDDCDPKSGCFYEANSVPCEDGNLCTIDDYCEDKKCVSGKDKECVDGNICTDDSCKPLIGCVFKNNNLECNDNNKCTENDICSSGECKGSLLDCNDNILCTNDYCKDGNCYNDIMEGYCLIDKICVNSGSENPLNQCEICDPLKNVYQWVSKDNETNCDDKNPCTLNDICEDGKCKAGKIKDCNDNEFCTKDYCDETDGECKHDFLEGSPCDDENKCTGEDKCDLAQQKCVGKEINCDDGKFCNGKEGCNPKEGCIPGIPPSCDDNVDCTYDSCDEDEDKCVNKWKDSAIEGPNGSATCNDEKDNDCDGKKDSLDEECELSFNDFDPKNGVDAGGTHVEITGGGFSLVEDVLFGGVSAKKITIISPMHLIAITPPHNAGDVDVEIKTKNHILKHEKKFRYTGTIWEGIWGKIQYPEEKIEVIMGEETDLIYGRVYVEGYTSEGKDPSGIVAEVGYGPEGEDPSKSGNFIWFETVFNMKYGNDYEYMGIIIPNKGGFFDIAYRFSKDGGYNFIYADLQDGSLDGYSSENALKMRSFSVVINELMWMGSHTDPEDEWIELRNLSDFPIILNGWKITGAKKGNKDLLLNDLSHTVNNINIGPTAYFLISEKAKDKSAINVEPEIICNGNLALLNTPPKIYQLIDADGNVIDIVNFSGEVGYNGSEDESEISMERNFSPGDGTLDENWHNADCHYGWDGDPDQEINFGTPGLPNCDEVQVE